jgi:hypothetical protein
LQRLRGIFTNLQKDHRAHPDIFVDSGAIAPDASVLAAPDTGSINATLISGAHPFAAGRASNTQAAAENADSIQPQENN